MRRPIRCGAVAVAAAFAFLLPVSSRADVHLLDARSRPADPGQRTYFLGNSATLEDALELRDRLIAAGAWNVNLFVQDRVIVCEMTPKAAAAIGTPAAFRVESARFTEARARTTSESWGWIAEAYERLDRAPAGYDLHGADAGVAEPFDDVVRRVTPEEARAAREGVERSRRLSGEAALAAAVRDVNQNSEVMGGSILANFVFPESDGSREGESETWSNDDLREARIGSANAFLAWQAWTQMAISVTFNLQERIPTGYEPIKHDMGTDELWVIDTTQNLGVGGHTSNSIALVHEYNEAQRALYRTQWVVTSFIACARATPNHRFGNGSANYTAYAYLGGPYMVEPFPAGSDPNGIGETLVYSKIVQHEVGHLFWTLDEYPGAPGNCNDSSGYLNYTNRNITVVGPGGEGRCEPEVPCIMHSAPREGQDRPWCRWSRGHLGVIDDNDNGYPDIFEAEPEIVFEPEGPETVTTNHVTIRFRARAGAVANRNVHQDPSTRVDYAAPLGDVRLSLGSNNGISLTPLDGHLNEIEEEFEFPMSLAQVGQSVVVIRAENTVGFGKKAYTKRIYFTGVNYSRVGASARPDRIDVTWETVGDVFNAQFDVYRLLPGEAMPGTRIAENVPPLGPGNAGFVPYRYIDRDVEPGHDYRYYVEGSFALPYGGSTQVYSSPSEVVGQTAAVNIPEGELVSGIAPNPSNGNVTLSIRVPKTYGGDPRAPQRLATPLEVAVYDVRGHRIRVLDDQPRFDDFVTLHWDGTTEKNTPVPAGIYFVRVTAGEDELVRKLVLLR